MKRPVRAMLLAGTFVLAGCATTEKLFLSSGPHPRVEDCAEITKATPTLYVCDGKTYTSVQLTNIRDGAAL
jgi:uncharacterized lipoprotein YajG